MGHDSQVEGSDVTRLVSRAVRIKKPWQSQVGGGGANHSQRSQSGRWDIQQDNHDLESITETRMRNKYWAGRLSGDLCWEDQEGIVGLKRCSVELVTDRWSDLCESSDAGLPCWSHALSNQESDTSVSPSASTSVPFLPIQSRICDPVGGSRWCRKWRTSLPFGNLFLITENIHLVCYYTLCVLRWNVWNHLLSCQSPRMTWTPECPLLSPGK